MEGRKYGDRELLRWMGEVDDFPMQKCMGCNILRESVKSDSFLCALFG